jgi:Secretory lipase
VNRFRVVVVRALLAVSGGICLFAAFGLQLAYPQTKSDRVEKIPESRRTFPITKFYDAPNPLPSRNHGDLIRSEEFEEYGLPSGILAVRILYHSRSASGQDVAASGVVLYPEAKTPPGGWPVIAWAHALHGVARQCAPSLARNLQHGPILAMYVNLGYAVVATDYTGLGTRFRNAFSDVPSNATDVIYSVRAARAAVPQLGSRWIAIGIGQGGPAVIGVAELEKEIRDPNYLGSMAISGLEDWQDRYQHPGEPTYETPLFLAYGIRTVFPEFEVKEILTDKALSLYPRVEKSCGDPIGESKLTPAELLKSNWENNRFVRQYFSRNTLSQKPAQAPIVVMSSELDPAIPIRETAQVIARMCKRGDQVEFERYPQSETASVFGDSVRDQMAWIQARFAGRAAAGNCSK